MSADVVPDITITAFAVEVVDRKSCGPSKASITVENLSTEGLEEVLRWDDGVGEVAVEGEWVPDVVGQTVACAECRHRSGIVTDVAGDTDGDAISHKAGSRTGAGPKSAGPDEVSDA